MENLSLLGEKLAGWGQQLLSTAGLIQFALLMLALALSVFVAAKARKKMSSSVNDQTGFTIRNLAWSGTQRLIFPLVMLVVVILLQAILNAANQPTHLFDVAVPLLLSLALVRLSVFLLRRAYTPSALVKAWENAISTGIWIVVALHLLGVLPEVAASLNDIAITIGEKRITVLDVIKVSLSVALFLILATWISRVLEQRVMNSRHLGISMRMALSKTIKIVLLALAILIALNSVGVDLTALTVFGGALGVGVGLGLQSIASNFISGMILLYDRSIRPGDVITIGDRFGWVQELRARYIVVRDREGVETLIPNENLITSEVISWSHSDRAVRVKIKIQISYASDPEEAMAIMLSCCEHPRVLKDPPVATRLMNFGENGMNLEARVWIQDPESGINSVRSDINLAIWKAFKKAGITIPYPQRDIHIRSAPTDSAQLEKTPEA